MQLRESHFGQAAELFYEAAAIPELWPKALQSIADASAAAGVVLLPITGGSGTAIPSPSIKDFVEDFLSSGWLLSNSNMKRGMALTAAGMKGLITSRDMYSADEFARDPYVNEFAAPRGIGPVAGMVLAKTATDFVLPITLERRRVDSSYEPWEVQKLNQLMANLQPGAILALNIGLAASQRAFDSLTGIGKHAVLIGGTGRVLYISPTAEAYVGDVLTLRAGVVSSWNREVAELLSTAIARATSGSGIGQRLSRSVILPRRSRRTSLLAQVIPVVRRAHDVFMLARAIILLTDPESETHTTTMNGVLTALGLSLAESRLATRIGRGEDLRSIAISEGISIETARSRLKAVFGKTGTHRQVELAVLLANLSR